jgi:hypothetical protein
MTTTITYEGTLPGSRIEGELVQRHEDGSVTVAHPDGNGWTYRVRPEHIIAEDTSSQPTVVDVRFAGGAVVVEQDAEYIGDGRTVVVLSLPGHTVALFPREARALAAALTAHANAASAAQR